MKTAHNPRRAAILAAAARHIARDGYHGMSMRDLARTTRRGLSSLYDHFASKTELLFALQSEAFLTLVAGADRAVHCADSPSDRLEAFVLHHVRYFAERPDVMRVLVQEAGALPSSQRAAVRGLKERYFEIARGVLAPLVAPDAGPAELERVTYCFFGMLNWIYGWYDPRRHGSPETLARTIHRLVLRGVAARDSFALDALVRASAGGAP